MEPTSSLRARLDTIAGNLWWCWHPEVGDIFRDLDPDLWRGMNHNPVAFLRRIDDQKLAERTRAHALESRILAAARRLDEYLQSHDTWGARYGGTLVTQPVAYFSAEFGLHESLPLYSGGLGVLAGDHLKSASDLGIPIVGVGLFYVLGYFTQRLDPNGWQREEFGATDLRDLPIQPATDAAGRPVRIEVYFGARPVTAAVWKVRVGRAQLLLLDTDVPENPPELRDITHRLYWGDQTSRIRQEIVLGIGGVRALKALGIEPGVFHLNEGHSAFALLEAVREEMDQNGRSFEEASHRIGSRSVFTTHTPVPAGHDRFPPALMEEQLGWMRQALGLTTEQFMGLGRVKPEQVDETFCMTVIALKVAHRANGVSSLHGDVSRKMWNGLWPYRRVQQVPIGHITNGVHTRSWIAPEMMNILERHLGPDWARRISRSDLWRKTMEVSPLEIWETHQILKAQLVDFVRRRYVEQELRRGTDRELALSRASRLLDPMALTLGFARRFATYKRATLMFRDRERFIRMISNPARPVQVVFAGKSHPRDEGGKRLIQEIAHLQHEEPFLGRIVFIEDYDINVGRHLTRGVDVWVNNPRRPEEACGTSGMKAVLNGALNCSILDGWWAEAYDGRNGFAIRAPGPHEDAELQDRRDAQGLFEVLEKEVVPLFYAQDAARVPAGWVDRMRWAFVTMAWRYSADRMVMDYARETYLPAAFGDSCRMSGY